MLSTMDENKNLHELKNQFDAVHKIHEHTHRWIVAMDTKASFLCALNLGVMVVLWSGTSKFPSAHWLPNALALAATFAAGVSILFAITVVAPRAKIGEIFGRSEKDAHESRTVTFYGHIAQRSLAEFPQFWSDFEAHNLRDLSRELAQDHFISAHVVQRKAERLRWCARLLAVAVCFLVLALAALIAFKTV